MPDTRTRDATGRKPLSRLHLWLDYNGQAWIRIVAAQCADEAGLGLVDIVH